jgi:hypothetical protein
MPSIRRVTARHILLGVNESFAGRAYSNPLNWNLQRISALERDLVEKNARQGSPGFSGRSFGHSLANQRSAARE